MRPYSDWLPIGLMVMTIASVPSLHVLGFLAAMPEVSRQFADLRFTVGLIASLSTGLAIAAFFAFYAPKLLLGVLVYTHGAVIESKYYRKGYRRAYVPFTEFGRKARRVKTRKELADHLANSAQFNRSKARFANFKNRKLNAFFPVALFSKYQYLVSIAITTLVFSVFYVGWLRSLLFFALLCLVALGLLFFNYLGNGYIFDLNKGWWDEQEKGAPNSIEILDVDILPTLFSVVAICSFCLGYLRFDFISHSSDFSATINAEQNRRIIGPKSDGILLIERDNNGVLFIPYSELHSLQMK